jgi:hypothetical protein
MGVDCAAHFWVWGERKKLMYKSVALTSGPINEIIIPSGDAAAPTYNRLDGVMIVSSKYNSLAGQSSNPPRSGIKTS